MPTTVIPTLFGRVTAALGDHTNLLDEVRALRNLSVRLRREGANVEADAFGAVDAFAEDLLGHFANEESASYYGAVAEDAPHLAARISHLCEQHRQMEAQLRRVQSMVGDQARRNEFTVVLEVLLDDLASHERAENSLLQGFFGRDEGRGEN